VKICLGVSFSGQLKVVLEQQQKTIISFVLLASLLIVSTYNIFYVLKNKPIVLATFPSFLKVSYYIKLLVTAALTVMTS
jgi:hypothetical protein